MKRVLITGAYGFLGRHTARKFKDSGCHVTGIGHGKWYLEEYTKWGIDTWLESTITFESLMNINERFDIIVHCGGSGSVAFSHSNPYEDFQKSVQSTLSLLEYIRLQAPKCKFIYPSSPAVQGNLQDLPIQENIISNPISPYGFNKKIAEELCLSYRNNYDLDIGIIRFFSIYGKGLQKQLIYDACKKIVTANGSELIFFGTGKETRDWINVEDAGALIVKFSEDFVGWDVVNGASGVRTEIQEILRLVAIQFDRPLNIIFNGVTREGDPKYFWADMSHTLTYDWNPKVVLSDGIREYVEYFKQLKL